MKKKPVISEREIEKAVAYSCHLEGMDYYAAMKNKEAITLITAVEPFSPTGPFSQKREQTYSCTGCPGAREYQ